MPTSLPVTVDTLRAALTSSTVQSQESATALYHALEKEVRNLDSERGQSTVTHGVLIANPPALPYAGPTQPRRAPLSDADRKHLQEFAEEYYLRGTLTTIPFDNTSPFVPDSTNAGTAQTINVNRGLSPRHTPILSPVTVDILAAALTNLGLQNRISATSLYRVLGMGLGERDNLHSFDVIDVPRDPPVSTNHPTQTPTGPNWRRPRLTDAQRCRMREAGEEYGRWLDAHPGYWRLPHRVPHHADNIDEATEQKFEGQ